MYEKKAIQTAIEVMEWLLNEVDAQAQKAPNKIEIRKNISYLKGWLRRIEEAINE